MTKEQKFATLVMFIALVFALFALSMATGRGLILTGDKSGSIRIETPQTQ